MHSERHSPFADAKLKSRLNGFFSILEINDETTLLLDSLPSVIFQFDSMQDDYDFDTTFDGRFRIKRREQYVYTGVFLNILKEMASEKKS
jgi:hypothetical protein